MSALTNPALRLRSLLERALAVRQDRATLDVWGETFALDLSRRSLLLRRYADVIELAQDVASFAAQVAQHGHAVHESIPNDAQRLAAALAGSVAAGDWRNAVSQFPSTPLLVLASIAPLYQIAAPNLADQSGWEGAVRLLVNRATERMDEVPEPRSEAWHRVRAAMLRISALLDRVEVLGEQACPVLHAELVALRHESIREPWWAGVRETVIDADLAVLSPLANLAALSGHPVVTGLAVGLIGGALAARVLRQIAARSSAAE